jgi:hypothetical protein
MIRSLIAPLLLIVLVTSFEIAQAQNVFPAPLPGQQENPPANYVAPNAPDPSWYPPIAGGPTSGAPSTWPPHTCMNDVLSLREEAERRGHLVKAASDRHASAGESCKLISEFITAEVKMIKYLQVKSAECGIPPNVMDQLNAGHKRSESMRARICAYAGPGQVFGQPLPFTDFGDPVLFRRESGLFKISPEPPSKKDTWIGDPPPPMR